MRLLVLHHAPSASLRTLGEAVLAGAADPALPGVEVVLRDPLEATVADVLGADGYVLGTAAHFGFMSGALKHFFDRTFVHVGGSLAPDGSGGAAAGSTTARRPFGLWVHGRYDTTGAVRSVLALTAALRWEQAAPVLEALGDVDDATRAAAYELGATVAAVVATR